MRGGATGPSPLVWARWGREHRAPLRLVRAGKVRSTRRTGPLWVHAERCRVYGLVEAYRTQTAPDGDWRSDGKRMRGQEYQWQAQSLVTTRLGVTSGAALVIARREATRSTADKRPRSPTPQSPTHTTEHGSGSARATPRRDSTLVISPRALDHTDCFTRHVRRRSREPFGDG